ncbi:NADP-dependent oxidoreductase [Candidatus Solirubrobacter pratensis]|uniref:NADP-dependent oxidoreductase n=1 Tax=Candidatus Solirubrobacter pratensis TaxID=1298857 RepID=UPI0004129821|nr:NADP-dependent oxidoreductase [Candidatus Solirubrobacter pratensis]
MRAIALNSADTAPALREDLPAPTAAENEVLVRVHASSLNPVDNSIASGMLAQYGVPYEYPVILGRDYAGVVEQVGAAVSAYRPGDQVFGFVLHANPTARAGAWAELITVTEELSIAPAPEGVELAIAGAAPLAGITAITAVDALELSEGDVLLVVGATGGVGSLAVQLAARAGARVIAPALPEDEQFLRELGVTDVITRGGDIPALVRELAPDGADALLDLVNYAPGSYDAALKPGARVASPTGAAGEGPGRTMVMAAPTAENLTRLGALLADGALRIPVQATYPLAQAPEALAALTGQHTQGKLAIEVR